MKLEEILTEEQLEELDYKKLKNLAAAGTIGAGIALNPMAQASKADMSATQTQQTQQVQNDTPKDNLKNIEDLPVAEKKKVFFDTVKPLVKKANNEILQQRKKLVDISKKTNLTNDEKAWLEKMFTKYNVASNDINVLLKRVDIIPESLALSQAAIESGWGTSRFAQHGNALFGQRDYTGGGITPKGATGFTVAKFDSLLDSIRGYMRNLNTQQAYKQFRDQRATMRQNNEPINGVTLAKTLHKYSERGSDYIRDIITVMKHNDLI